MNSLRQLSAGIFTAIGSSLLVLAAISLAILEGQTGVAFPILVSPTAAVEATSAAPVGGAATSPTIPPAPSATTAQSTGCPAAPAGWFPYSVQPGDTLEGLAALAGVTAGEIMKVNCLIVNGLLPGMTLNLPIVAPTNTAPPALPTAPATAPATAASTALPTAVTCGVPYGWVPYIVHEKDTLFRLSQMVGVSVAELQFANCITGTKILTGQTLWLPFIPVRPPTATMTQTPTPTIPPSDTPVIIPTTEEPSSTPTPTDTPTATPTDTPEPSATPTDTPTNTVSPASG